MRIRLRLLLIWIMLISLSRCIYAAEAIQPFTTDGCSAFPEGTTKQNELWLECCTEHDRVYWQGGSYMQRLKADTDLQECVAQLGEDVVALLMLTGVRIGGSPFFPTSFRWGYGWSYPRFYGELNDEELDQIKVFKGVDDDD